VVEPGPLDYGKLGQGLPICYATYAPSPAEAEAAAWSSPPASGHRAK